MDDVIAVKEKSFRNGKHKAQWSMTLREYAKPLHKRPIAEIARDDVVETLKPIWEKIPETADRLRMCIAAVNGSREGEAAFMSATTLPTGGEA
ncbi:hypothetical protein [Mesorhizobium sp. M0522]|uniref:phage integrase central domain-containing protein n=1 Tax=Mesorhizobium sp. M0522 TaxID=2956958 RepID=UPI003335AA92